MFDLRDLYEYDPNEPIYDSCEICGARCEGIFCTDCRFKMHVQAIQSHPTESDDVALDLRLEEFDD